MATKPKKAATDEAFAKEPNGEAVAAPFVSYEELADLGRENFAAVLKANAALSCRFGDETAARLQFHVPGHSQE